MHDKFFGGRGEGGISKPKYPEFWENETNISSESYRWAFVKRPDSQFNGGGCFPVVIHLSWNAAVSSMWLTAVF